MVIVLAYLYFSPTNPNPCKKWTKSRTWLTWPQKLHTWWNFWKGLIIAESVKWSRISLQIKAKSFLIIEKDRSNFCTAIIFQFGFDIAGKYCQRRYEAFQNWLNRLSTWNKRKRVGILIFHYPSRLQGQVWAVQTALYRRALWPWLWKRLATVKNFIWRH